MYLHRSILLIAILLESDCAGKTEKETLRMSYEFPEKNNLHTIIAWDNHVKDGKPFFLSWVLEKFVPFHHQYNHSAIGSGLIKWDLIIGNLDACLILPQLYHITSVTYLSWSCRCFIYSIKPIIALFALTHSNGSARVREEIRYTGILVWMPQLLSLFIRYVSNGNVSSDKEHYLSANHFYIRILYVGKRPVDVPI